MKHGNPCFVVSEPGCPELVKGFDGKYHYPEKYFEKEPEKVRPEKNFWSNIHDALQYGVSGFMRFVQKKPRKAAKAPSYKFGGEIYGSTRR